MLRKSFLLPAVIVLAGLLASADPALAQRRGGRGSVSRANVSRSTVSRANVSRATVNRGTWNRGTVNRGTWNGTWNRGAWNGNRYYANGSYGNRYGNRYYGNYYRGYGWPYLFSGYSPYYSGYGYGYGYPYVNNYPYSSYYADPYAAYGTLAPSYSNAAVANSASVEVIVPNPNATVWFDGAPTTQMGTERWFQTATLTGNASYTIRATWNDGAHVVTRAKTVVVSPGQTSVVDFTY
jgi:uncharacterized protein (TIGR03000 family)